MGTALLKPKSVNKVVLIDVKDIVPNPSQPRTMFNIDELKGLSESIVLNGLLQPLTVRKKEQFYELISGERRLRAVKLAGINSVPCIIVDTTDKQSAVFALLENLQRSDLTFFEEAVALKGLIVEWGLSQAEIGERLGKAQSTIANKIRLLKFNENEQRAMVDAGINEHQARALLKITDEKRLCDAIEYISINKLNVAQTEAYIDSVESTKVKQKKTYTPIVKDVRIFFNTINNAIKIMNQSGINASAIKIESGDYIEYVVKIPRINQVSR